MTKTLQTRSRSSRDNSRMRSWLCAAIVAGCSLFAASASARTAPDTSQRQGYHYYEIGDMSAPRPAAIQPGLMLVGGGEWPYEAFRWMIGKAGHGRIVILRASGADRGAGRILQGHRRHHRGADPGVRGPARGQRSARCWRSCARPTASSSPAATSPTMCATGRARRSTTRSTSTSATASRLGGTSAGLAIMGAYSYGAMDGGSLTSEDALKDPMGPAVTLVDDFLQLPPLPARQVITDSHFGARDRLGSAADLRRPSVQGAGAPRRSRASAWTRTPPCAWMARAWGGCSPIPAERSGWWCRRNWLDRCRRRGSAGGSRNS